MWNTLIVRLMVGALLSCQVLVANALTPVTMCAFTLMGEGGPDYQILKDYQTEALNWGVKLKLKSYMNEKVVVEELKAGECDLANMTGMQARQFNKFTGTLDALGAIPDYKHLKMVLNTLSQPKAAKYMKQGEFEIAGIQPTGAIFLFVRDRYLRGLSDLAGRKIGVLDTMPEMRQMVVDMGMTPVSSTVTNIFQKFNNGVIDITGGPAIVYEIMELEKGLDPGGAIIESPLLQSNVQLVGRISKLPEGFAQKSREFVAKNFDDSIRYIKEAEKAIPRRWWLPVPECQEKEMDELTRKIRMAFRDNGIYEAKTLTLLRKVRCKQSPERAECTAEDAE